MKNEKYISLLKKALASMDKASRGDIINEIQSYQIESGLNLLERFGAPEEMAAKYLDGEVLPVPITKKIGGFGKKIFLWFGVAMVILIGLSAFIHLGADR